MAKSFGFDAPGACIPGIPIRHEVWKAFKKMFLMGPLPRPMGRDQRFF